MNWEKQIRSLMEYPEWEGMKKLFLHLKEQMKEHLMDNQLTIYEVGRTYYSLLPDYFRGKFWMINFLGKLFGFIYRGRRRKGVSEAFFQGMYGGIRDVENYLNYVVMKAKKEKEKTQDIITNLRRGEDERREERLTQ